MESTGTLAVSSNHQVVDEDVLRDIGVQEHAAAVQLLNRSLALAHLRAELVKPRWVLGLSGAVMFMELVLHAAAVQPLNCTHRAELVEPGLGARLCFL